MGEPAIRRATYQDVLDAPANMIAEVLGGQLRLHPRPRIRHARAASRLGVVLGGPFDRGVDGPGGWILLDEPELHLGSDIPGTDILVPDLAGWRRETLATLPDEPYFTVRPDWVCEVLSPSTAKTDRADKLPVYAREGVSHAWLIDPGLETLEVFRLDGETYRLVGTLTDAEPVSAKPFDAVAFDLGLLFER